MSGMLNPDAAPRLPPQTSSTATTPTWSRSGGATSRSSCSGGSGTPPTPSCPSPRWCAPNSARIRAQLTATGWPSSAQAVALLDFVVRSVAPSRGSSPDWGPSLCCFHLQVLNGLQSEYGAKSIGVIGIWCAQSPFRHAHLCPLRVISYSQPTITHTGISLRPLSSVHAPAVCPHAAQTSVFIRYS